MRYQIQKKPRQLIVRSWFAIFPVTIGTERRWLEKVNVEGYYWVGASGATWWVNERFVE
jgi:hypothetical protein